MSIFLGYCFQLICSKKKALESSDKLLESSSKLNHNGEGDCCLLRQAARSSLFVQILIKSKFLK